MRHVIKLVLAVALAGWLGLPSSSAGPLADWLRERRSQSIEENSQPISLPAGARVLHDLAYGPAAKERLDVYLPSQANRSDSTAPVMFMVHGGAWRVGDKTMSRIVQHKIDRWLPKGFIFVSIDYPMLPDKAALAQADEVARALAFAQSQARSWGGDPDRFIVMGHSAGAHLVALLAASPAKAYALGARPWLGTIALDSAALDVEQIMDRRHLPFYDAAFGSDRQRWRLASPIDVLTANARPMLAVCSLPRPDHSCAQSAAFVAKANRIGVSARVLEQDLSHAQINEELGLPGAYTDAVETFMAGLDPTVAGRLR